MRIIIDYDGSTAKCVVTGATSFASYPNVDSNKTYDFNELDPLNKAHAIAALECVKQHWIRENKLLQ